MAHSECLGCTYGWPVVPMGSTIRGYICRELITKWHEMPVEVHSALVQQNLDFQRRKKEEANV